MPNKSILIVEDNPINLKLVYVLLSTEGYKVKFATDAEEALIMLREFHPALILMDLQLPGMDGLQLTKILKENPQTKDTIIIALTAYAMKGDEEKALNAGCDSYITKPISINNLLSTIERYLKK
ncbi:MAG TPA: response regulator [Gammaproteobacteria bacterium]|nr:response regulator [Gammaproteobacteria bacterium]